MAAMEIQMTADPVFTLSDAYDPALRDAIYDNFIAHAAANGLPSDFRLLAIRLEKDGVLLGGMMGRTGRGWLSVDLLALPISEHGAGIGTRLMAMAEREAARRGCHDALLYTAKFQAPGFYEKLGYQEFARLPHDNPELTRIWFHKRLP